MQVIKTIISIKGLLSCSGLLAHEYDVEKHHF